MIAEQTLDYTHVAVPLTIDDIHRDIDACCSDGLSDVDKIVMWVHQWEYLIKGYISLMKKYATPAAGRPGWSDGELLGVPVEVLKPWIECGCA